MVTLQFCVFWLRNTNGASGGALKQGEKKADVQDVMADLADSYKTDPVKVKWVDNQKHPEILRASGGPWVTGSSQYGQCAK